MSLIMVLLMCLTLLNICLLLLMKNHKFSFWRGLIVFATILIYFIIIVALITWETPLISGRLAESIIITGLVLWAYLLYEEIVYKKQAITKSSIKESVDNLPMGLSFSTDAGIVLLSNKVIENLSYRITGKDLQDAESFWQTITGDDLGKNIHRLVSGDNPTIRFEDGHTWTFSRKLVMVNGKSIRQITAVDTTELDTLQQRLKEDNESLAQMGNQLRLYVRDVTELKAGEERLAAKMRIHDELGYALLASKHLLGQNLKGDALEGQAQELMALWKRNIALLRGGDELEKPSAFGQLEEAGRVLGVKVNLIGQLSGLCHIDTLILSMAGEFLNNAVRHGGADELSIEIAEYDNDYLVVFSNNGSLPKEPVSEGGGLSGIRRKLGDYGGELEIDYKSKFNATARIPKERGGRIDS